MPQLTRLPDVTRAVVFAPLDAVGRADRVEQRLGDAIVLGVLRDGEKLPSEAELARRLGVAVVTAREALEALRARGLVQTRRGREGGSFVTFDPAASDRVVDERLAAISRIDIRDLAAHYTAIAGTAAELAADRATDDDVASLRALAASVDGATAGGARRGHGRFRLDVAALSQSARLVHEELRLQAEFGPLLWMCLRDEDYRERSRVVREETIDAIESLDPERARHVTSGWIGQAIAWLIDEKTRRERNGGDA
ncbi:FadR/GntR family transcriptional regulator [Agromyces sp. SYSU T00194]|uniref:FadR/GntR family transcriptional regulator n=1 Tax=Agromyces chitinivorans TaxID=3158560 RepID=UPI003392C0E0